MPLNSKCPMGEAGGDMTLTTEEVQEKINLTGGQQKAWTQLVRAVKKCNKEKVFFYQVIEYVSPLNGKNVADVMTEVDEGYRRRDSLDPLCLQHLDYPVIKMGSPLADDNHFVRFVE